MTELVSYLYTEGPTLYSLLDAPKNARSAGVPGLIRVQHEGPKKTPTAGVTSLIRTQDSNSLDNIITDVAAASGVQDLRDQIGHSKVEFTNLRSSCDIPPSMAYDAWANWIVETAFFDSPDEWDDVAKAIFAVAANVLLPFNCKLTYRDAIARGALFYMVSHVVSITG